MFWLCSICFSYNSWNFVFPCPIAIPTGWGYSSTNHQFLVSGPCRTWTESSSSISSTEAHIQKSRRSWLGSWLRNEGMQVIPGVGIVKITFVDLKVCSFWLPSCLWNWWHTHEFFLPFMFTSRCGCGMAPQGRVWSQFFVTVVASSWSRLRSHSKGR